ncbi:MAG: orotidine-5'-phosphate decarboxylase [Gammaproteobacteria bacterium]|nr:orotidine-5'-phosphate decarboxylase [Gammaproteobacteria bacterium]
MRDIHGTQFTPPGITAAERLIVALDFDSAAEANLLIEKLEGAVNFYKVGWQLFLGEGWPFIRALLEAGRKVFLDLKINDIDRTVEAALANMPNEFAGRLELLTIHGGSATVAAARRGRGDNDKPYLLMLTVLSSMDATDLKELSPDGAIPDTDAIVLRRARQALDAGCEGLIASGSSVRALRRELCDREFLIVTPGIRPAESGHDDHKRTLTPGQAIADGADYLVVGRPITQSPDPLRTAQSIIADMETALDG